MRLVFVGKGVYLEVNTDLSINLDQIFVVDRILEKEGKGCVEERKRGKVV